jgi:cob(I)alamin adenosyltransferase
VARIYTKAGDDGTTELIGGKRVSKDSACIHAYGSVDELNAILGVICSSAVGDEIQGVLGRIQDDLFTVGAELALPEQSKRKEWGIPGVTDADILFIENAIDLFQPRLAPIKQFILPGGSLSGALLHYGRTVARRAERCCVAAARTESVDPQIIRYLNRLSDLLFVLARVVNRQSDFAESHPSFGKLNREGKRSDTGRAG